jgi:hypothetical protein
MAQSLGQSKSVQEGLRLMNKCPLCTRQHTPEAANILVERNGTHLVHITCPFCCNAILAVIVVTSMGLSSVGMVTDLKAADVLRLRASGAISEDELLDFYTLLKNKQIKF